MLLTACCSVNRFQDRGVNGHHQFRAANHSPACLVVLGDTSHTKDYCSARSPLLHIADFWSTNGPILLDVAEADAVLQHALA
jgi:hypothetical protein